MDIEQICLMLYADDIVILGYNANELPLLLNALNDWCNSNDMTVNGSKSNIIHFRPKSCQCTNVTFMCGDNILQSVDRYTYLGVLFHEHLDNNVTVKSVIQSASSAMHWVS